jgi:hypothetical protein
MISDREWLFYLGEWEKWSDEDFVETLARNYMAYRGRGEIR